jgi:hypothetical protein
LFGGKKGKKSHKLERKEKFTSPFWLESLSLQIKTGHSLTGKKGLCLVAKNKNTMKGREQTIQSNLQQLKDLKPFFCKKKTTTTLELETWKHQKTNLLIAFGKRQLSLQKATQSKAKDNCLTERLKVLKINERRHQLMQFLLSRVFFEVGKEQRQENKKVFEASTQQVLQRKRRSVGNSNKGRFLQKTLLKGFGHSKTTHSYGREQRQQSNMKCKPQFS